MTAVTDTSTFATIEDAIEEIRAGRFVVVVDDEDRENEGDLTIAAEFVTPEAVNFMATHGRGLICLCLTEERCDELGLRQMTEQNEAPPRHRLHGLDRGARGCLDGHLRSRPGTDDPGRGRSDLDAARPRPAGSRLPAARA